MFSTTDMKSKSGTGTETIRETGRGVTARAFASARRAAALVIAGLGVLQVSACLSDPATRHTGGSEGKGVEVTLHLQGAALAKGAGGMGVSALRPVDSVHITVTGADMDTLRYGFPLMGGIQTLSMIDIPPGADRRFQADLMQDGRPLYSGSTIVELRTDRANAVSVICLPDFSRITASIHIPVDFPKTVAGGHLRMWNETDTLTAPAVASGELKNFRLEEVPGDREYAVALALWDPTGDTIATAYKAGVTIPKGQNVALVLPLALAYTQIALAMTLEDPMTTTLVLSLPGGKRTPSAFGDAVFSEVHPDPGTDEGGENGEWLELFNRATDTLDVSGCLVVRDAGVGTGMKATLPANTLIPPGKGLVLGRSASVTFAAVITGTSLNLVNSSARLELTCAALSVDTLRYNTTLSDSLAARIAPSKVATLKPSRLATRHRADAWCFSLPPAAIAAPGDFVATPGGIIGGCGE